MKAFASRAKKHPETSASSLRASAAVPNSGFEFVDNSQGASAAVSELSTTLGDALDLIDLDGNTEEKVRKLFHDLDQEASKYSNSSIDVESAVPWVCTSATADLVSWAWKCTLGVYTPNETLTDTETHRSQRTYHMAASAKGVVKAMTCTVVRLIDATSSPILIIAIRGSASKIDHVVNANSRESGAASNQFITGHAGFLHGAEALLSEVTSQVLSHRAHMQPNPDNPCHIILTGHSAGGAVASLLYLLLSPKDEHAGDTRFSCITFGAPPCVSSVPENLRIPKPVSGDFPICLNIINEFDFVTRADPPYLLCVVNLLRSMYGLPNLVRDSLSSPSHDGAKSSRDTDTISATDESAWPTPPRLYHHVGDLIVLATRLDEHAGIVRMHALTTTESELSILLFCRLAVHRRACYAERVSLLQSGKFNGQAAWDAPSF